VALRIVDAGIALYTLPRAWQENSTGRWVSPTRRDPNAGRLAPADAGIELVIDLRDRAPERAVVPGQASPADDEPGLTVTAERVES
jgi:hypothetical protein